jgi:hydrogenase small subunit
MPCDGESVALTAATQPSIEDLVLGGLPGLPEVNFHNPFYGYEK